MNDIARELNISQSTVSRVLTGKEKGRVSTKKAELIKKTAFDMGYQINLAAVGLRNRKSYTIGILLPSPRDVFVGKVVADLQHLISDTEYIATFAYWETLEEAGKSAKNILSRQVDAIITCEPGFLPDNLQIPVVAYGSKDNRFDYVGYNYEQSLRLRIDYLKELGHLEIAYLGEFQKSSWTGNFGKILKEYGFPHRKRHLEPMGNYFESGWTERLMNNFDLLWEDKHRPTAIIAQNDASAILILRRAWERGIKIPEELSVIGIDNIPQGATSIPSLTTVDKFDNISVAETILKNIFSRIKDPHLPLRNYIARSKLIKRESCAPPGATANREGKNRKNSF
jgi:LacI family transcriptional regulator